MTHDEWTRAFAAAVGVPAPSPAQVDALLQLAGVAAHASERTAAPIACWLAAQADLEPAAALAVAETLSGRGP